MGSSPRAVRHAGGDPVTATMTFTSHSCHAGQAAKPTTSPGLSCRAASAACPRPKITRDRPHLSPELAPSPLDRSCVILTGHAHACHGPRWGRELARIGGQQWTTTDNDAAGQPTHWLVARPPRPRLQRRGHRFEPCHAHHTPHLTSAFSTSADPDGWRAHHCATVRPWTSADPSASATPSSGICAPRTSPTAPWPATWLASASSPPSSSPAGASSRRRAAPTWRCSSPSC
jgi:hypothetical protein